MADLSVTVPVAARRAPSWVAVGGPRRVDAESTDAWIQQVCAGVAVAYRMFATAAFCLPWLAVPGWRRPVLGLVVVMMLIYNVVAIRVVLDKQSFASIRRPLAIAVDMTLAVLVTSSVGLLVARDTLQGPVGWSMMSGTVALWTIIRGRTVGVLLALLGLPVALVLTGVVSAWDVDVMWPQSLSRLGQCSIGVLGVLLLQPMVWASARSWRQSGVREGSVSERVRTQRIVHDTTIQTLEAIALLASSAHSHESDVVLRRVGALAGREADALRARLGAPVMLDDELDELAGELLPADGGLLDAVRDLVTRSRAGGLDVMLVDGEYEAPQVSASAASALSGAVGEALTNVAKHSGASRAVVRITSAGGVQITVRDNGRGFDPARTATGFGLRESVHARMSEVGGAAGVISAPGDGVLVRLRLPPVGGRDASP